jgi:hypothetical protein
MHNANTSENTILAAQAEVAEGLFVIELEERLEMAAASGDVITVRCI